MSKPSVVVSGMRPTGKLHLGNYWGALKNWVDLQADAAKQCFFFVADWHMLTTGYDDTSKLKDNTREIVLDWLAAGIDPEKSVIFKQSDVPEHAELALMLGMIMPLGPLENNPTWKEQVQELAKTKFSREMEQLKNALPNIRGLENLTVEDLDKETVEEEVTKGIRTYGFLGYPVLQAADVLLYKGQEVPVGQDQLPHLELTREIARRFNHHYGNVLPEPKPLVTQTPKLPGNDGRKMSKSYGNTVELNETTESLAKKVMGMYTDPTKLKATSPGHPDPSPENPPGCVVYALHKLYTPEGEWKKIGEDCRAGALGCVKDKKELLLPNLERAFAGFRERRKKYESDPRLVDQILESGKQRASAVAKQTMSEVRRAMRLS